MDWDSLQNLVAVALGGLIASMAGRSTARRENRAEAMGALSAFRALQSIPDALSRGDIHQQIRQARAALLAGGVRWVYVEMSERLTSAIMRANWELHSAKRSPGPRADYAWKMTHPSRWLRRPLLQLADVLEQTIAEGLERPVRARLLAPIRELRLRTLLKTVRDENEITRMPPMEGSFPRPYLYNLKPFLAWPNQNLLMLGGEAPATVPDDFWPDQETAENDPYSRLRDYADESDDDPEDPEDDAEKGPQSS